MTGPLVPRFLFLIYLKSKGITVSAVRKYTVHIAHGSYNVHANYPQLESLLLLLL